MNLRCKSYHQYGNELYQSPTKTQYYCQALVKTTRLLEIDLFFSLKNFNFLIFFSALVLLMTVSVEVFFYLFIQFIQCEQFKLFAKLILSVLIYI